MKLTIREMATLIYKTCFLQVFIKLVGVEKGIPDIWNSIGKYSS
jgi:hypothetical protein